MKKNYRLKMYILSWHLLATSMNATKIAQKHS